MTMQQYERRDIECVVDCGSEVHAIPVVEARKWSSRFQKSALVMRGVDGNQIESCGQMRLCLRLSGELFTVIFEVLNCSHYILSVSEMEENGFVVH